MYHTWIGFLSFHGTFWILYDCHPKFSTCCQLEKYGARDAGRDIPQACYQVFVCVCVCVCEVIMWLNVITKMNMCCFNLCVQDERNG